MKEIDKLYRKSCNDWHHTLIKTVSHPISHKGRREELAQASEIHIKDDVWIEGKVTILSRVKIKNNVVIGAGTVVQMTFPTIHLHWAFL